MKFGKIKSKIDYVLLESFKNENHFKDEMKFFKSLVLENKNISRLYYLYDELKNKKNVDKLIVNDFINESITIYENLVNKISKSDIRKINEWLFEIEVENEYENIDNLFSNEVLTIEEKIKSKKIIIESLTKIESIKTDLIELPISSMVNLANKTIKNYLDSLNESDRNQVISFLSKDESELKKEYEVLKEDTLSKLDKHKYNSDKETSERIDETISKLKSEKFDKVSYLKIKNLNENL